MSILPVWVSTQSTEDPYDIGTTTIAEIIPTATLTLAAGTDTASTPPPDASVSPLAGHSYFFIDYDCYGQTNLPGWQNKGQYVEQAILDATEIADKSGLWPQYGTDTSDLYFGQDFDQSAYQQNTSLNLLAAANWGDGTYFGYFRPYIVSRPPFSGCYSPWKGFLHDHQNSFATFLPKTTSPFVCCLLIAQSTGSPRAFVPPGPFHQHANSGLFRKPAVSRLIPAHMRLF